MVGRQLASGFVISGSYSFGFRNQSDHPLFPEMPKKSPVAISGKEVLNYGDGILMLICLFYLLLRKF